MSTTKSAPRTRAAKASLPVKSATGATPTAPAVAGVICPAAPRRSQTAAASQHQTHGAVTPLTGAISSVAQLTNGGHNVAKGSSASFESLAAYTAHLRALDLHSLRRHAIEDARIVPIDDRERLIRRLEVQWTTTAARQPGRAAHIPTRAPFTQEQTDAQNALKNQLLRR